MLTQVKAIIREYENENSFKILNTKYFKKIISL